MLHPAIIFVNKKAHKLPVAIQTNGIDMVTADKNNTAKIGHNITNMKYNISAPIVQLNNTFMKNYTAAMLTLKNSSILAINRDYKVIRVRRAEVQTFSGDIGSQTNQEFNGDIDKQTNIDNSKSTTVINNIVIKKGGRRKNKNKNRKNKNKNGNKVKLFIYYVNLTPNSGLIDIL